MNNPLKVSLENIIPLTEARDHFSQIVTEVQKDKLYVLTKGGKPAVAIIDVKYLETLTGGEIKEEHVAEEIKKAPEKVGLPPMVEHNAPIGQGPLGGAPKPFSPLPPKTEPPKPAGFAAPRPPVQDTGVASGPQPPPSPPTSNNSPSSTGGPSPLKTPPVDKTPDNSQGEKIDVQFSDDSGANKRLDGSSTLSSPDDKTSSAQYAGSSEEPEDMSID